MGDFFQISVISRNMEILMELNYCLLQLLLKAKLITDGVPPGEPQVQER